MRLTKEVKVALVAVAGVIVLFFGLKFLKGLSVFSTDKTYYIAFKDISGVSTSCPIYAGGYKVGTVTDIDYDFDSDDNTIIVEADINPNLRIPVGSTASISSDMMGNVKMDLQLLDGTDRQYVEPGGTIQGALAAGALDMAADLVPALQQMMPKIDSIMTSLNTLLADPALAQTLRNAETITNDLTTTTTELNRLMLTLNSDVPAIMSTTENVMANADTLTLRLNAIDLEGTMARVDQTLADIQQMTAKVNAGQGTLGLMLNDPTLYNNLSATMAHADSLVVNLREHPKRYVHFSLFGKKDK